MMIHQIRIGVNPLGKSTTAEHWAFGKFLSRFLTMWSFSGRKRRRTTSTPSHLRGSISLRPWASHVVSRFLEGGWWVSFGGKSTLRCYLPISSSRIIPYTLPIEPTADKNMF